MLSTLIIVIAAVAAATIGVVTIRWPRISAPAVSLAASLLIPGGAHESLTGDRLIAFGMIASGIVAGGWALVVAIQHSDRLRAEDEERAAEERSAQERAAQEQAALEELPYITSVREDLAGEGHTITVERVDRPTAREWSYAVRAGIEDLTGRRAVVERHEALRMRVADATAVTLCRDNRLPILVFELLAEGNIARAVKGEKIGTLVSDQGTRAAA